MREQPRRDFGGPAEALPFNVTHSVAAEGQRNIVRIA